MCGIAAYAGKHPAEPFLINALRKLEYRGYDGCGYLVSDCTRWYFRRELIPASQVQPQNWPGHLGIAHTRWATHGRPEVRNTHPVFGGLRPDNVNQPPTVAVVHNGVIDNYERVKTVLTEKQYQFLTDTDTEAIANYLDYIFNQLNESICSDKDAVGKLIWQAFKCLKGTYTVAIYTAYCPSWVICVNKGLPLVVSPHGYIASDAYALDGYTDKYYSLQENEVVIADADSVQIHAPSDNSYVIPTWSTVPKEKPKKVEQETQSYMEQEIFEQPDLLKTYTDRPQIVDTIPEKVFLFGCGSSYNAALLGRYYIEKLVEIPAEVDYASELLYRPIYHTDTLFVGITQSGETADTLMALKRLTTKYRNVITLTNNADSKAAKLYPHIDICAGKEIGVAATKTFTLSCVHLLRLAIEIAGMHGIHVITSADELCYKHLPVHINEILRSQIQLDKLKEISKEISKYVSAIYLARSYNYPIALEGALKLKEVSYLRAEAMPSAEMKHGPIATIDDKTVSIFIVTNQHEHELYNKVLANINEIKARSGKVLAITDPETTADVLKIVDWHFCIPKVHELIQPIVANIPLQLLAYYTAIELGRNVDRPRNLAKSVTVE